MLPKLSHIVVMFLSLLLFAIPLMGCTPDKSRGYPPCLTEETGQEFPACYWDGDTSGNKTGVSFINTESGDVIYL